MSAILLVAGLAAVGTPIYYVRENKKSRRGKHCWLTKRNPTCFHEDTKLVTELDINYGVRRVADRHEVLHSGA